MAEVDGRTKRAEEAREQRRRQILDAALRVFAEQGYHGTAVSDLVKAAGVARGTFYLYFDAKEAIFHELLEGLLSTFRESIRGVDTAPGAPTMEEQLVAIVADILRTTESNRPLTRIIFREAIGLDEAVDDRLNSFYKELYAYIELTLTLGEAAQMIRPVPDKSLVATCVTGSLRAVVQRYVVDEEGPVDVDAVARVVVDHNLRGLLVR